MSEKNNIERIKRIKGTHTTFLYAVFCFLFFVYLIFEFSSISIPLLIGALLIVIFRGLENIYSKISHKIPFLPPSLKKPLGVISVLFLIIFFIFILSNSASEISNLFDNTEEPFSQYYIYLEENYPQVTSKISERIESQKYLEQVQSFVVSIATDLFSSLSSILFNSLLIIPLLFSFYFSSMKNFSSGISSVMPKEYARILEDSLKSIKTELIKYLEAKMLEIYIISIICCIGYFLVGLEGWLVLGVFTGFLNFIPYIGPVIGMLPALFIGFVDSFQVGIGVLIIVIIAQLVDNFYVNPVLIPKKVKINSLLAVILTLLGAQMYGSLGMVLFVPLYLIFRITFSTLYKVLMKQHI